jgi:hypothetical protein
MGHRHGECESTSGDLIIPASGRLRSVQSRPRLQLSDLKASIWQHGEFVTETPLINARGAYAFLYDYLSFITLHKVKDTRGACKFTFPFTCNHLM